jgi:two-component system chemotaxis response regulator CheY
VLVVEDHSDTRKLAQLILEEAGYDVRQAGDGAAALDLARAWHPHLIVTDVFMDGMDGVDLIHAIRRQGWRTKLIAVSAGWRRPASHGTDEEGPDVLDDAVAAGADATLFKPLDPRELLNTVGRLLDERDGG